MEPPSLIPSDGKPLWPMDRQNRHGEARRAPATPSGPFRARGQSRPSLHSEAKRQRGRKGSHPKGCWSARPWPSWCLQWGGFLLPSNSPCSKAEEHQGPSRRGGREARDDGATSLPKGPVNLLDLSTDLPGWRKQSSMSHSHTGSPGQKGPKVVSAHRRTLLAPTCWSSSCKLPTSNSLQFLPGWSSNRFEGGLKPSQP